MTKKSPAVRLVPHAEVLNRIGKSRSSLYRWVVAGTFPPPVENGGTLAWREDELQAWIDARPRVNYAPAEAA